MASTQFFGAFNDTAFKQLILLLAVDLTPGDEAGVYQSLATALFALPFLLFSGIAGSLADRFSKTPIIRFAKVAEVGVMLAGLVAFSLQSMPLLLATLFLMGAQSAFFGPAKYGILPQMLPARSLPRANGVVLGLTFMAIILGTGVASWLKEHFGGELWKPQTVCVVLAVVGTMTAMGVRWLRSVQPDLRVRPLGDLLPTLRTIWRDRGFALVVAANAYFWFLGSVVMQMMNRFGKKLMGLGDDATGRLLVSLSIGMAIGSLAGGMLSRNRVHFAMSGWALCGVVASLAALAFVYPFEWATRVVLVLLGASGGMFTLPFQTFVQLWPPRSEKGRVVAATNFVSWVFICLSAAYFWVATALLPTRWVPMSLAVVSALLGVVLLPRLGTIVRRPTDSSTAAASER